MREAEAPRKVVVVGTLSDFRGDASSKYVQVAKDAIEVADQVLFVGPWASRCLRARQHADDMSLRAFTNVKEVIPFLKDFLQPGDLVLLKGSAATDHLENIVPALRDASLSSRAASEEIRRPLSLLTS